MLCTTAINTSNSQLGQLSLAPSGVAKPSSRFVNVNVNVNVSK